MAVFSTSSDDCLIEGRLSTDSMVVIKIRNRNDMVKVIVAEAREDESISQKVLTRGMLTKLAAVRYKERSVDGRTRRW